MTNLAVKPSPVNSLENDELPGQSQNFLDNDQGVMTSSSMHRL